MLLCSVAVGAIAVFLSGAFSVVGFMYPLIHLSTWLMFLPITLTMSCVIILYCNAKVLMAARQRMRSRSSRRAIVGYYHRECESSELLGTPFSASTDDLEDLPASGKRGLCVEMIPF